jgi:translation initiation factor IF-1
MAKEEKVTLEGTVVDALPDGQYMVEVEGGHQILGYTSGKMRRFNIRIVVGDRVTIETSPYDLTRGRITYRHR